MNSVAAWMLMQAALVSGAPSYEQALADSQAKGRPLLVLIGADWCPGCRTMKQRTMPRLAQNGKLKPVEFAHVDTDHQEVLANKLMRGNSIPQLILFTQTADGWKRTQLTGAQSERAVETFIQEGLSVHVAKTEKPSAEGATTGGQE